MQFAFRFELRLATEALAFNYEYAYNERCFPNAGATSKVQLPSSIWRPNDRGVYITTYYLGRGLSHVCRYDLSLAVSSPKSAYDSYVAINKKMSNL